MRLSLPILIGVGLAATACQTLMLDPLKAGLHDYPQFRVYSGVRYYTAEVGSEGPAQSLLLTADLPFSFALDTLLLPVTVPAAAVRSRSRAVPLEWCARRSKSLSC